MISFASDTQPLTVPIQRVSIRHSVTIVWPDGARRVVEHLEDVSHLFDPTIPERTRTINFARCQMERVATCMNLARCMPSGPKASPPRRPWWAFWQNP